MRVGAHLRAPGGPRNAVDVAREVGAEVVPAVPVEPSGVVRPPARHCGGVPRVVAQAAVGPLFAHAPYLVNIASIPSSSRSPSNLQALGRRVRRDRRRRIRRARWLGVEGEAAARRTGDRGPPGDSRRDPGHDAAARRAHGGHERRCGLDAAGGADLFDAVGDEGSAPCSTRATCSRRLCTRRVGRRGRVLRGVRRLGLAERLPADPHERREVRARLHDATATRWSARVRSASVGSGRSSRNPRSGTWRLWSGRRPRASAGRRGSKRSARWLPGRGLGLELGPGPSW